MKKIQEIIYDLNLHLENLSKVEEYVVDIYVVENLLYRALKAEYDMKNMFLNHKKNEIEFNNNINYQGIGLVLKVKKKKIQGHRRYDEAKFAYVALDIDYDRNNYLEMNVKELDDIVKVNVKNAIDAKENKIENEANEYIALIEKYGINQEDMKKIMNIKDRYKYEVKSKVEEKLGYYL